MPRQVPQLDASGAPVRDKEGKQAMVPNEAREIWVTATTLVTALNLGIVAYALSGLVVLLGLMTAWTGVFLRLLARRAPFAPKG